MVSFFAGRGCSRARLACWPSSPGPSPIPLTSPARTARPRGRHPRPATGNQPGANRPHCHGGELPRPHRRPRRPLWRAVRHGREGGAVTSAIEALFLLGNDAYFTGRWDELTPLVDEGLALCEEHGYRLLRWPGLYLRALVPAPRRPDDQQVHHRRDVAIAGPGRIGAVLAYTDHIKTHAALTRGDFDTAYRHATRINPADELTAQVTAVPRCARRRAVPTPRLAIAGATAMAASEHRYRACFDDALTTPAPSGGRSTSAESVSPTASACAGPDHPPPRGTPHRGAGEFRTAPRPEADHQSTQRTAGQRLSPPAAHRRELTAQQGEVAELAAAGLTNNEISARLFLSALTVGNHLYQIFPQAGCDVPGRTARRRSRATRGAPARGLRKTEQLEQSRPSRSLCPMTMSTSP